MKRKGFQSLVVIGIIFFAAARSSAHCEIPCGIYDDKARISLIAEHITTIEKAMKVIISLQDSKPIDYNQLVRWITNKDKHACEIQSIVSQYFLTQRIKPDSDKYKDKLVVLHKMLVESMKCKQTTDLNLVNTLRTLLKEFQDLYFEEDR
ncbi:Nickel-containing superoxide dismutase [uncultured Desulfobacterium sp.]|uniref:Nickel-containing superoxide dismutase n=1 Tax=uncultured Desulfobacterium sp. TaxID=201089 RepID=A0A445MYT2_9BACT|nr:Nickel-containing superoxide dismutase [uncultured Desulfobacterium sp.]